MVDVGIVTLENSNEWLRRKRDRDAGMFWFDDDVFANTENTREVEEAARVTLWVDAARGRHQLSPDVFPLEEVMSFDFVGEVVVNGFSLWLKGREVFWQRLGGSQKGVTIPQDGTLTIDMRFISVELSPFTLS